MTCPERAQRVKGACPERAQRVEGAPSRTSRSWHPAANLTKTAVQVVFFWGFFLAVLPWLIVRLQFWLGWGAAFDFLGRRGIAFTGFLLCSALGLWSAATMAVIGAGTPLPIDCPNRLVVSGPYRVVRNPMVLAGIGQGLCVGLALGSWMVLVYSLLGAIAWQLLARPWEERDLAARFGGAYEAYRRAVRCWIPRWPPAAPLGVEPPRSLASQDHAR